ncbi:MAG TPA: zeta toxin family protein [Candidatus Solibacter sp.]|nr:zeta toxin family protein [Candidatus Solibacter sp.]
MDEPRIYVLAGTNGAGKSSVGGAEFRACGTDYFNPDEAALRILAENPGTSLSEANSAAWQQGKRLLERAIARRKDFAFETTLGGNTIPALLESAASSGIAVHIWFVGLSSPELHIQRVRLRVAGGGHDIPEDKIRERYDRSRENLIQLLPKLTELRLLDNSTQADLRSGAAPQPRLILHWRRGRIVSVCDLRSAPEWTKPILTAVLKLSKRQTQNCT